MSLQVVIRITISNINNNMTIVNNTNNYHEHCQITIYNIYNIYNKNSNMREKVTIIDSSVYILFIFICVFTNI